MNLELSEKAEALCRAINKMEPSAFNNMLATDAEEICTAIQFIEMQPIAKEKGWTVPINDAFSKEAWVHYWMQCIRLEKEKAAGNENPGRPIAPHRSGG